MLVGEEVRSVYARISIDWICFAVVCRLISNLNLNLLFAYLEMCMASPSNTRQLFVLLCPLFVLLQNSRCAPAADQWGNNTVNSSVTTTILPALPTNSSIETTGSVKGNTRASPSTNPPITIGLIPPLEQLVKDNL